jgi:subtilase family serine protease
MSGRAPLRGVVSLGFAAMTHMSCWLQACLPATAAESQLLHGQRPAVVANLQPIGVLEGSKRLNLVIGLPLRNKELLASLLQKIYDPTSPQYRHYLTPEQFTEKFGPSKEDYQAVMAFAQSHGLKVAGTAPNRVLVDVNGAVADIEQALHVRLRVYEHPTETRTFFAPDVEPSVDLAVPILAISGLSDYVRPKPLSHRMPSLDGTPVSTPNGGSGTGGSYMGADFRKAYLPGISLTGSGQTVGLLEIDGYYTNDIIAYETQANLPNVALTNVLLDSASGLPGTNEDSVGEVSLDIETAIAMAPGLSQVIVYEGTSATDILNQMATDNLAKQLSSSWDFASEGDADFISQFAAQFAAQGQTFFQSSGDDGAYYQGVAQWAANPNVTVVGGTVLTTSGDASWQSETAWSDSGGGVSVVNSYQIPSWQDGLSNAGNNASTMLRNSPDVAMVAQNVWVVYNNGSTGAFYGTSIGAPLWAGLTALINQQAEANGQSDVGFLNPALYSIGAGPSYSSCFHDITDGNNANSGNPVGYNAVPGYDLCTGWGTPNSELINVLAGFGPTITITSPTTGTSFPAPASFIVSATASDASAVITNVQFLLNGSLIGNSAAAPYKATAKSLRGGAYLLEAVATDSNGLQATNSVTLSVNSASMVLTGPALVGGQFQFIVPGIVAGTTNYIQASSDLSSPSNWSTVATIVATGTNLTVSGLSVTGLYATNSVVQFFRLLQTQ